jgi:L-asparaginase
VAGAVAAWGVLSRHSRAGVLLIYTGGTVGSLPQDPDDPLSPLVPVAFERVLELLPFYDPATSSLPVGGAAVRLDSVSWPVPVDSSNITREDWHELATIIRDRRDEYAGFVILHGTDTLAYTASALAFMLGDLDRPVVLTGSQRPIGQPRSDAVQNLVTSIEVAAASALGRPVVAEVCVFFRDRLFRGCRVTKVSATGFNAFDSPNMPPLAAAGDRIEVDERLIARPPPVLPHQMSRLEERILCVTIFPDMSADMLESMLTASDPRGIVLQTFGNGNCPANEAFLDAVGRSVDVGRLVVTVTQCGAGEVDLGAYPGSLGLLSRGVLPGMDMTPEAAMAKLSFVLGTDGDPLVAADRMQLNLRGEQRQSIFNLHFGSGEVDAGRTVTLRPVRPMTDGRERYRPASLERAVLRVLGVSVANHERGSLELSAWLDLPSPADAPSTSDPRFLGRVTTTWREAESRLDILLDVTGPARELVDPRRLSAITIAASDGVPASWQRLDLALYADC